MSGDTIPDDVATHLAAVAEVALPRTLAPATPPPDGEEGGPGEPPTTAIEERKQLIQAKISSLATITEDVKNILLSVVTSINNPDVIQRIENSIEEFTGASQTGTARKYPKSSHRQSRHRNRNAQRKTVHRQKNRRYSRRIVRRMPTHHISKRRSRR